MKKKTVFRPNNFGGLPAEFSNYNNSRFVVIPVPFESTTEWISGCRFGPRAIIEASVYLEWYEVLLDSEIHKAGIHTLSELEPDLGSLKAMLNKTYTAVKDVVEDGKIPVVLGGEHSISTGAIRAVKETYPQLTVIYFDAHLDQRDRYLGSKYGDACVMRRAGELCPVFPVGIRSFSKEEKNFVDKTGLKVIFAEQIVHHQVDHTKIFTDFSGPVYLSIDLDVFDPSVMPAVGTPEPGGLQWYDMIDLLKSIAKSHIIAGFDIVELVPNSGSASCAFMAARLAYIIMGLAVK